MGERIETVSLSDGQLEITRLGLGAARLMPGRAGARLVEAALEAGIRHFDTAPSYGAGLSERLLGDVLSGVPGITITTKVGIARPDRPGLSFLHRLYQQVGKPVLAAVPGLKRRLLSSVASAPTEPPIRRRLDADEIERSLDTSISELRRCPDIFLVHEPAQFLLDDPLHHLFERLQREGRFRVFGSGAGGIYAPDLRFGSIWQGRYAPEQEQPVSGLSRILHGLLRHAPEGEDPLAHMARIWRQNGHDAFLVSTSTPEQLKQIVARLNLAADRG